MSNLTVDLCLDRKFFIEMAVDWGWLIVERINQKISVCMKVEGHNYPIFERLKEVSHDLSLWLRERVRTSVVFSTWVRIRANVIRSKFEVIVPVEVNS